MDIPLIYPKDSHGVMTYDINKIDPEESVLTASITHTDNMDDTYSPTMHLVYNNIDYKNIPNLSLDNVTYMHILTYNGTMGRTSQLYTQTLQINEGILDPIVPLEFTYTPKDLQLIQEDAGESVVLNVNFYTAEANILQFTGVPVGGTNEPFTNVYRYSYPFTASVTPTDLGTDTYFDGWYTSTLALFRDAEEGQPAIAGEIYSYAGVVGKATASGVFGFSNSGDFIITQQDIDVTDIFDVLTYEEFILKSNNILGINSNDLGVLANTQILVTDEINNAIINELKAIACDPACDDACTIADWQKLQQKRIGAYIYFTEESFRQSQVIMESARKTCALNSKKC